MAKPDVKKTKKEGTRCPVCTSAKVKLAANNEGTHWHCGGCHYDWNPEVKVKKEAPPVEPIALYPSLREAVFLALGEASMCWNPRPQGVFDSSACQMIGEELLEKILANAKELQEESDATLLKLREAQRRLDQHEFERLRRKDEPSPPPSRDLTPEPSLEAKCVMPAIESPRRVPTIDDRVRRLEAEMELANIDRENLRRILHREVEKNGRLVEMLAQPVEQAPAVKTEPDNMQEMIPLRPELSDAPRVQRKTVAFAFDGVICADHKPVEGALDFIRKCQETHFVVIETVGDVGVAGEFLSFFAPDLEVVLEPFPDPPKWNFRKSVLVTNRVMQVDTRVDARALRFKGQWWQVATAFRTAKAWSEKRETAKA